MPRYEEQRNFLKSDFKTFSAIETDKQKGFRSRPMSKPTLRMRKSSICLPSMVAS
jgi:hypothetical protein